MKKNNKLAKFTALVLIVTIIALILVAGTYAKYTTKIEGSDVATVAKFKVGSTTDESFDLFSTVTEADGKTAETDVAEGKVAPGTGGKFAIDITNESEVKVDYVLALEETANTSSVPIEYSIDGTTYVTADKMKDLTAAKGSLDIGTPTAKKAQVTVYWRWAFTGDISTNFTTSQTDTTDLALGTASTAPTVTVKASTTFTQVD